MLTAYVSCLDKRGLRTPSNNKTEYVKELKIDRKGKVPQNDYQTSKDRELLQKQRKFPTLTAAVYIQNKEVPTHDGYRLIEPMLDESAKPHELHLVKKVGTIMHESWWVKGALKKLGFETDRKKQWQTVYSILPNTKEINDLLWMCKHLVRIVPVKFKNGYPSEQDLGNTRLNLVTGEFEIVKPLEVFMVEDKYDCVKINDVSVSADIKVSDSFGLNREEILKDLHRRKELRLLNDEHFPAVYDYKYDQDKPGVIKLRGRPHTDVSQDDVKD
jgi:hypothetical protein